ncbi:hypothetical protein J437_LFUL013125 [Ladona fulva]|uniref:Uncharacterized protein n=1 Tax=Ladona fulva TaxID=123851 RepID=A0A8K0KL17_LADFU|nr:hypothetical protein J437_LFUL013125 [Ladona fulva]
MSNDPYLRYYLEQAGSGVGSVYRGVSYQKGNGIGSFLGGLFRSVLPLFKSGAKALGRQAIRTGMDVIGDLTTGQEPVKAVLRRRFEEAGENLKTKAVNKIARLSGDGYTLKKLPGNRQSIRRKRAVKTRPISEKRRKLLAQDIFS